MVSDYAIFHSFSIKKYCLVNTFYTLKYKYFYLLGIKTYVYYFIHKNSLKNVHLQGTFGRGTSRVHVICKIELSYFQNTNR